jgi:hypothetical protein
MALFDKDKREARKQERATRKEEKSTMKRAEAMASAIEKKPAVVEEQTTVVQPVERTPGVTIVEAAPDERTEQKTTSFSPEQVQEAKLYGTGEAILNTLNSPPKSGEIILNSVYNDPKSTLSDIQNAKNLAEVANQEEEKEKSNLQDQIYQGPGASNQNLIQNFPNATSSTLTNIGEQQGKPSFETTGTKEQVMEGMDDQYKKEADSIPAGVIEKLGVQDYYPQIGRDVAVGTFTGSRIGSQTIYSGAGVLLPMGLYDARKRALAEAATERQKKIEEYLKIGDTLPQFNSEYKNYAYNTLVKYAEKHKYNPNDLFKDREFMNEKYRLETLGKEIEYVGGIVDGVFEKYQSKDGKPGSFVPDDVMKDAIDFRSGIADMDAVLSGKSRILDVGKRLRTYTNGTTWADGRLSEWKSKPTELPINLKNQEKMTIEDLNKIQEEIKKVKINGDHDSYITAVSKHYKLDPQVIDSWIAMNMPGASDKDKEFVSENLNKYILSQMPDESIETKIESLSNKSFDREEAARRQARWQADYDRKIQEGQTHWQARNKEMNFVDATTGKPMAEIIGDLKRRGITGDKLNRQILEVARRNGITNATIDPYTKSVVIKELASSYENSKPKGVNNSTIWVNLKEQVVKNGKKDFNYFTVKASDLPDLDIGKRKLAFQDDTPLTKDVQTQYRTAIKNNKLTMRTNSYDLAYGYADAKKNDIVTINPENISGYDPKKMVFVKKSVGRISTVEKDEKTGTEKYISLPGTIYVKSEFSSKAGINSNDEIWGQGIKSEPGFGLGQGAVVETGTYSSSSEEE